MADRREKVTLILDDQFTTGMARAAAATALLDKNLSGLDGSTKKAASSQQSAAKATKQLTLEQAIAAEKAARLRKEMQAQARAFVDQESGVEKSTDAFRRNGAEIDRMSGRLRLITDAALTLGPALVPIGAAAVPALFALTAGFGAAAGAAGVALIAFNGVGDAMGALNDYQLAPTTANLTKLNEEMAAIGPAGASFVRYLDELEPQLRGLQQITRAGLFPGVQDGIDSLLTMLPQVRVLLFNLSTALGGVAASAGAALSGDGFAEFFNYLETQAGPLLTSFAATLGNVTQGFASLIVAFAPLTGGFVAGMERMSAAFADWAAGVSETQGFADFVSYVQRTGPQVVALLGSLATAFIGILTAAAPVGEALLPTLTALASILASIASSPIGPPLFTAVAALLAVNRAATLASAGFTKLQASATGASAAASKFGAGVSFIAILTGIGAIDAAFNKLSASINETDLSRNLEALSRGESIENFSKIGDWISQATSSLSGFNDKLSDIFTLGFDTSALEKSQQEIEKIDQALASLVESGQGDIAANAFGQIIRMAGEAGVSVEDAKGEFDSYLTALENSDEAAAAAAAATEQYAAANDSAARVTRMTRAQVQGLVEAMEEQTSAALGAFDAVTQYAQALADAQKRAKNTEAGIDASTAAGRKNRDALSQLAGAWNNQGAAVRNNMDKWREARAEFIAVAREMGATGKEARNLADRILEIPRQRAIDIKLYGSEEAANKIEAIRRQIESVPKVWRTTYYVNQVNSISRRFDPSLPDSLQRAGGGPIYGPGTKTSDSVPVMASRGEFMMSAAAVDHYGLDTMFKMNARRLASGGSVDGFGANVPGLTPNSQLYGLDQASLSVRELADRIGNLSRVQFRQLGNEIDGLGEKNLTKLSKALDLAAQAAEENTAAAKEHRDAVREDIAAVKQQIAERFRSDIFGQQTDVSGLINSGLSEDAAAMHVTGDPLSILRDDIRDAQTANGLYERLEAIYRRSGGRFTMRERQALLYAQENASLEELSALAGAPGSAQQYANLYGQRQEVTANTGQTAALQRFGAEQRQANQALAAALKVQERMEGELKDVNRELRQMRKENKANSDSNARKTTDGLNDVTARAGRGR